LAIDSRFDGRFEPVERFGEISARVSVLIVDRVIKEKAALWDTARDDGLGDVTGEAVVSGFGVEPGLRDRGSSRSDELVGR